MVPVYFVVSFYLVMIMFVIVVLSVTISLVFWTASKNLLLCKTLFAVVIVKKE